MNAILECILKYFSFLYDDYHCKFVDSEAYASFSAYLIIRGDNILIKFTNDRDRLFLEFQTIETDEKEEWYSIDIIKQFIIEGEDYNAFADKDNAYFLRQHFHEVQEIFKPENFPKAREEFHKLEQIRAKKLFG